MEHFKLQLQRQYVLELDREWGFYSKHEIDAKLYKPQL